MRRAERRDRRAEDDEPNDGVDPDIAGIVPGPQPHLYLDEDELKDEEEEEEEAAS